jgi:hypothetical protein
LATKTLAILIQAIIQGTLAIYHNILVKDKQITLSIVVMVQIIQHHNNVMVQIVRSHILVMDNGKVLIVSQHLVKIVQLKYLVVTMLK